MSKYFITILSVLVISFIGCASDSETHSSTPAIDKIIVTPADVKLKVGDNVLFKAKAFDSKNNEVKIIPVWKLSSNISRVGSLNKVVGDSVIFTANSEGSIMVLAEDKGKAGKANIQVIKSTAAKKK